MPTDNSSALFATGVYLVAANPHPSAARLGRTPPSRRGRATCETLPPQIPPPARPIVQQIDDFYQRILQFRQRIVVRLERR